MTATSLARQTITVIRAPLADDGHGNQERDWSNATETASPGWSVQPLGELRATAEVTEHRDAVKTMRDAWGPAGADVLASDRVRVSGITYEVVGDAQPWVGATGRVDHTFITLQRWEG